MTISPTIEPNTKILELLDAFELSSKEDYHRLPIDAKHMFVSRLYKAFERNFVGAMKDASQVGGMKFHFSTDCELSQRSNIPTSTFLKKSCFYANRTYVSFPFVEAPETRDDGEVYFARRMRKSRKTHGTTFFNESRAYVLDKLAFDELLDLIFELQQAMRLGISHIVPLFPGQKFHKKKLKLTSANFELEELKKQFDETEEYPNLARRSSGLSNLLLPHFTNIEMERIVEIRNKESELYQEFQRRIQNMLHNASQTDSEITILKYLREVDEGVRELHERFKHIQKMYRRRDIYFLLKFLSASLVFMSPLDGEIKNSIATILGGMSAFDYLTTKEEKVSAMSEIRLNRFYLPWQVFMLDKAFK